jgi:hypothetical protein
MGYPLKFNHMDFADGYSVATMSILDVNVTGEAYPRCQLLANGSFLVGTGAAAPENTLFAYTTDGVVIGGTGDKLGFFGHIAVVQQTTATTPSGGATQDAESRTAIGQIKTALTNLGLTT